MLTDKIDIIQAADETTPEDFFAASLGLIFTDDVRNQHGDPDAVVVYKSSRFGAIKLTLADPQGEEQRRLFAHYLWNAGLYLAELISEEGLWSVKDEIVLELGAGVGLCGIVSCLAGAIEVVISDYPAPALLSNISKNVLANIPHGASNYPSVTSHVWGVVDDTFSNEYRLSFSRILVADCLWMPSEHRNLAKSIVHFLTWDGGRVFVVAGFHTGRAKLALFFDIAFEEKLELVRIEEVDVEGKTRPWLKDRDGGKEDVTERKRWLVVAMMKHRGGT